MWNNCDDLSKKINVISINASNCKNNSCSYKEVMSLDLSGDFLKDSLDRGFSMRLMSKKKTNKVVLSKPYIMGYLKVVER